MFKKRTLSLLVLTVLCISLFSTFTSSAREEPSAIPIFEDPSYSYEERAADLVARMTAAQKAGQMVNNTSAITKDQLNANGGGALNVPATMGVAAYTWWQEALHGYSMGNTSNAVSYPQNYSAASSWDPAQYYQEATEIGNEIRERSNKVGSGQVNSGNSLNLMMYSPTVNLSRDPRWGRNEEGFSEDPYLAGRMGASFVNGLQGNYMDGTPMDKTIKVISTPKHYTANNSERNRLNGGATITLRELRDYYTVPYRNIIKTANNQSIMTAYSYINLEPVSKSSYLMETLLRQIWGFSGFVTSDCDAFQSIKRHNYVNPYTGQVLTPVEYMSQIMAHGGDHECSGGYNSGDGARYDQVIGQMLAQKPRNNKGVFTENQLDVSAWRHFVARMKTGEFDVGENASKYLKEANQRIIDEPASTQRQTPARLALTEKLSGDSIVLLKNDLPRDKTEKLLPLKAFADGANVIFVGEAQTSSYLGLYSASVSSNRINIREGIVNAINAANPGKTINYTYITANTLTAEQETTVSAADLVVVTLGTTQNDSKEDGDRTSNLFPRGQAALAAKAGDLNANTVVVMETCGSMDVTEFINKVPAILWSSFQGMRKVGFGNVMTGAVTPGGKVTSTWYKTVNDSGASDIPSIYDYTLYKDATHPGRTYMYFDGDVSFEFGFGLSYTTFGYSNLKILKGTDPATAFGADDTVAISFDVTNTGSVYGAEVAQLYVSQPDAPVELQRPNQRLVGFEKVWLNPGETKTVTLNVKVADLAFYNEAQDRMLIDQGNYKFWVGQSVKKEVLAGNITVSGQVKLVPAVVTLKPNQNGDEALEVEERLIFDNRRTVNPQLTVALNDESLYGYIIKDQIDKVKEMDCNVPLPEGMTVSYSSNRPSVVSVVDNVITTVGVGVATVTATVTYNGASKSGNFIVYVVSSPYIENITLDGVSLQGFDKAKFNYSVDMPAGTTTVPTVGYVNYNTDLEISVVQAAAVPGAATINVENKASGMTLKYTIGFTIPPVSDAFSPGVGSQWTVKNPVPEDISIGENGLTIATKQGAFGTEYTPKNVYLQSAGGTWVAQTRITLSVAPSASNQQAGLLLYNDDLNYIRFVLERPTSGTTNVIRVYNVVNGTQTQVNTANAATGATSLSLQIIKKGDVYTFGYSANGTAWTTFGTTVTAAYALPQIGLWANNGNAVADSISATFNKLDIVDVGELYPTLASITLNGLPIVEFKPDVYSYTTVAEGGTVPVVGATAANPAHTVTINQAPSMLDSATVTVSSLVASAVYTISFSEYPTSDYMADGQIDDKWQILKSDPANWSIEKGRGIVLKTQLGDLAGSATTWTSLFTRPAAGNWEVVVKFHLPVLFSGNYHQAQVLAMQDDNNFTRVTTTNPLVTHTGVETNGTWSRKFETTRTAAPDSTFTSYVYIKKDGDSYTTAQSVDGVNFYVFNASSPFEVKLNNTKIAIFATKTNQASTPIRDVCYEYVDILSLNGVKVRDYEESLQWALDNVAEYVIADVPATAYSGNVFSSVPHGYTVSAVSSDPDAISNTGVITRGSVDKTVQLEVTVSEGTRTKIAGTVSVIVPKASSAVIESISSVSSLVSGYAANVAVKLVGSGFEGLTATLFGKTANVKNGSFYFNFAAGEVPAAGSYPIEIYDGVELVGSTSITVTPRNDSIWAVALSVAEDKLTLNFNADIALLPTAAAKVNGNAIGIVGVSADNRVVTTDAAYSSLVSGNVVTISGVKFPALFPKYSFTFSATVS